MEYIIIVGIVLIIGMAITQGVLKGKADSLILNEFKKELKSIKHFDTSYEFISKDMSSAISIDDNNEKICLLVMKDYIINRTIVSYKDILSSEIIEDNNSLVKTARGSQVGGALLGGLLLGGAGAIIGGLSGKKHNISKVKNIDLVVIINNIHEPIFKINFLTTSEINHKKGYDKNTSEYKNFANQAKTWHAIMDVIIKKSDDIDKKEEMKKDTVNSSNNLSTSDEIRKLKTLKDDGLITDDEFISQKNKILK